MAEEAFLFPSPLPASAPEAAPSPLPALEAAPAPLPAPETPGATLRRLHARAHPALCEFSALVSDYIDGAWLPEDAEAVGKRAVALGRRLLARETEAGMLQDAAARAEARAASLEAQLQALLCGEGGSVRIREELAESRAALLALQQSTGDSMGALFERYGATLAEENADLRVQLAAKDRELVELREVLLELRRSGGQERTELDLFGEKKGSGVEGTSLRKVNTGGGAREGGK